MWRALRDEIGAAASKEDPCVRAPHLYRVRARRLVAEEARASLEVELPRVIRADERAADEVALDERVARVRARVVERVERAFGAEHGHLAAGDADELASARR